MGAGPGDVGLITVRGLELLRRADVVVYDALVNPALLSHAQRGAELIDVGKRAAAHRVPQDQINDMLVLKAREGKLVVRLKGGDPYLFGRGAEELTHLGRQGVLCEVVPGVTAGIAAAATAGIPVTHRSHASTVCFITGHEDPTKADSSVDYGALAGVLGAGGTLVFYMGAARIGLIAATLAKHGSGADVPVAAVQSGTLPAQRTVRGTLATAEAQVQAAGIGAPAIIVVGAVAALNEPGLDWFTRRPLFGRRVLVTRTRQQASALTQRLEALGADVLEAPTIEVERPDDFAAVDQAIQRVHDFDWLVLTSVNGVAALAERFDALKLDARHLAGVQVAVIGGTTADACRQTLGVRPDLVPVRFVAEALGRHMTERGVSGKKVLMLRADIARPVLATILTDGGASVTDMPIYNTVTAKALPPRALESLEAGRVDWVTFTSSSAAKNMVELLGTNRALLAKARLASIGPITTQTMKELGLKADAEAIRSDIEGIVVAIVEAEGARLDSHGP